MTRKRDGKRVTIAVRTAPKKKKGGAKRATEEITRLGGPADPRWTRRTSCWRTRGPGE